jgi:dTDP-4-amino-4,6-dideoxygalactose transaminase
LALAKKHRLYVIEDSAHSIEGKYKGQVTGSIGDIGCYSFYATKNLTTGEGGLIVWNDDKLTDPISESSLHGLSADAWKRFSEACFKHYEATRLGFKYNMTDIQAALGLAHLDKIYDYLRIREKVWSFYTNEILSRSLPAKPPVELDSSWTDSTHARHLYIIRLELDKLKVDRDHILNALQAEGIGCGVHYKPLHLHKFYKETLDIDLSKLTNATKLADEILSIPISQGMSAEDASDVIEALAKVLNYYKR